MKAKPAPARRTKAPRPRAAVRAHAPGAVRRSGAGGAEPPTRSKAIDPAAYVVDPEQLLAALERGERGEGERATPAPVDEVPASGMRARLESGIEFAPSPVATIAQPMHEAPQEAPAPAPLLRENETALTTHSGTIVIRRRRAA